MNSRRVADACCRAVVRSDVSADQELSLLGHQLGDADEPWPAVVEVHGPTDEGALPTVTQISAGDADVCALVSSSHAYCWGTVRGYAFTVAWYHTPIGAPTSDGVCEAFLESAS